MLSEYCARHNSQFERALPINWGHTRMTACGRSATLARRPQFAPKPPLKRWATSASLPPACRSDTVMTPPIACPHRLASGQPRTTSMEPRAVVPPPTPPDMPPAGHTLAPVGFGSVKNGVSRSFNNSRYNQKWAFFGRKVRDRFDPGSQVRNSTEYLLAFFDLLDRNFGVSFTVNPQVPGSSPGRGAKYNQAVM
jgi:hypothetical protein